MYKQRLTEEEIKQLAYGNSTLLLEKLQDSDKQITSELKKSKDTHDLAFLQGASHIIDNLIKILESNRN